MAKENTSNPGKSGHRRSTKEFRVEAAQMMLDDCSVVSVPERLGLLPRVTEVEASEPDGINQLWVADKQAMPPTDEG